MPRAHVVATAVPAAAQLGTLQRPETQRQWAVATAVGAGVELPLDVDDENGVAVDLHRFQRAARNLRRRARAAIDGPMRLPHAADLEQRGPRRRPVAEHELLEADEAGPQRFLEIMAHRLDVDHAAGGPVELHVD